MQISKSSYGEYSSSNYGAHAIVIEVGGLRLWFSYDTVVAYIDYSEPYNPARPGVRVCENYWGSTTGKHLNWIDNGNKKARISRDQFKQELQETLERHKLVIK